MFVRYIGREEVIEVCHKGNRVRFRRGFDTAVADEHGRELCQNPLFISLSLPPKSLTVEDNTPLHVGITTARRKVDYLPALLAQLMPVKGIKIVIAPTAPSDRERNKAAVEALVPADAMRDAPDFYSATGVEVMPPLVEHENREDAGLEKNTDRLIASLVPRGDQFVTLQDDIRFCRNGVERMIQVAQAVRRVVRLGFVSFYTPYSECGESRSCLWPYPAQMFYGELAVLWRSTAAKSFLAASNHAVAHDLMMQAFFKQSGFHCFGHSPCLVQHFGDESATEKQTQGRVTMNWRGEHDAIAECKPW